MCSGVMVASATALDSQSVKGAETVGRDSCDSRGYDANK